MSIPRHWTRNAGTENDHRLSTWETFGRTLVRGRGAGEHAPPPIGVSSDADGLFTVVALPAEAAIGVSVEDDPELGRQIRG